MSSDHSFIFIDLVTGAHSDTPPASMILAIGNFDGVHLGHKRLIATAVELAKEQTDSGHMTIPGVFCFSAPPADYLMSAPPPHICSFEKKLELFRELGAKYAAVGDFSHLRHIEAEDFCHILKNDCRVDAIVCGFNFRFGNMGRGDADLLKREFGERAWVIEAVSTPDGEPISSSRVRSLLINGQIEEANFLLGHPFAVEGNVLHGKALGRQLGLPTINQNFAERALIPGKGIYVSAVEIDGKRFPGVTNIGSRPTVEENGRINCETHLLDFNGELYGRKISTYLLKRLRDEKRFSSEKELKEAIENDVCSARRYFDETT